MQATVFKKLLSVNHKLTGQHTGQVIEYSADGRLRKADV
jgi:hypothetical protein